MDQQTARRIANALRVSLFDAQSSNAKWNAQRNLAGRTHYVDDGTLGFFKSRILATVNADCGTIFGLVESVALDFDNTKRGFRFVVFDLTGTVVNDLDESTHGSKAAALNAMWQWLSQFDAMAHYRAVLVERAERAEQQAADMRAVVGEMV